jgi:hypothetical protein
VLASADGPSEELSLRAEKKEAPPAPKRVSEKPWGSKGKPKTLFDLLFGN